jgi:hypothetical protein
VNSRRRFFAFTTAAANRPVPPEARTWYPGGVRFPAEGIKLERTLPEDLDHLGERVIPVAEKVSEEGAYIIVLTGT